MLHRAIVMDDNTRSRSVRFEMMHFPTFPGKRLRAQKPQALATDNARKGHVRIHYSNLCLQSLSKVLLDDQKYNSCCGQNFCIYKQTQKKDNVKFNARRFRSVSKCDRMCVASRQLLHWALFAVTTEVFLKSFFKIRTIT